MTDSTAPEAGWYPDPSGSPALRWWDGERWSDATHPLPDPGGAPVGAPAGAVATQTMPPPSTVERSAPARHRGRAVALVAGLLAVLLVALAVLAYGFGRPRITTQQIEEQIAQSIADQLGASTVVTCPDTVDAGKGIEFTCEVAVDGGKTATVRITQTDDRGTVTWDVVSTQ